MEQPDPNAGPESAPAEPSKPVLPEPGPALPLPAHFRFPFTGHMDSPTAVPSATERRKAIERNQRTRRRRGFIVGLLAGQLIILALDFGGDLAIRYLPDRVQFNAPIPLRSLIFIGMTAGIVVTGLFIFFVLGAGALVDVRKAGFFTAVGRGMKRAFKAAWALGLTLSVIGGTAWFMIPRPEWKPTAEFMRSHGERALDKVKSKAVELLPKK